MWLNEWYEMSPWPDIWDLDFGFAPLGARRNEPGLPWHFNDKPMNGGSWTETDLHMLYNSQIAAALSRLLRIPGLTVQIRGENIWIHRVIPSGGGLCKLFDVESLLIRNLAIAAKLVMNANWIEPLSDDGTSNLQMMLGKFDIA